MLGWTPDEEPTQNDIRWGLHTGVGWRHSPLRKVRSCRRAPFEEGGEDIGLVFAGREDGGVDVGVNGTKTCGSWHSCLPCGARIAVHRAAELEHIFRIWEQLGNSVVLGTFTVRHHRRHSLRKLVTGQRAGWDAVTSDRPWNADLDQMGVARFPIEYGDPVRFDDRSAFARAKGQWGEPEVQDDGTLSCRRVRMVKGVIRAWECTHGDEHGWHPHFHVFFLVEGAITPGRAEDAIVPMWNRWCEGLADMGLTAVAKVYNPETGELESAGLDVKVLGLGGSETYGRYPFKLALEAVGGVFKQGREQDRKGRAVGRRHRTPTEIMEHLGVAQAQGRIDDDQAYIDGELWREFCTTANDLRIKQCPIPMRAWFAAKAAELEIPGPLLEEHQDDEDIAAAEVEGAQQGGHMSAGIWAGVVAYEFDTLRAAGRHGGFTGVVAWFDRRRIPLDITRTGEERLAFEREHPPPGARPDPSRGDPHARSRTQLGSDPSGRRRAVAPDGQRRVDA